MRVYPAHKREMPCIGSDTKRMMETARNLNSYLKCAFCAFSLGKKRFTSRIPSDTIV